MFTEFSQFLNDQISSIINAPNILIPADLAFAVILSSFLFGKLFEPFATHYFIRSREKDKSIIDQIKIVENSTMELTILKAIADSSDKLTHLITGVEKQLTTQITGVRDELKGEIQGAEKRLEDKIYGVEKRLTAEIATNATSIAVLSNTIDERIPKVPYSSRV
jgi:hypothetical protein